MRTSVYQSGNTGNHTAIINPQSRSETGGQEPRGGLHCPGLAQQQHQLGELGDTASGESCGDSNDVGLEGMGKQVGAVKSSDP